MHKTSTSASESFRLLDYMRSTFCLTVGWLQPTPGKIVWKNTRWRDPNNGNKMNQKEIDKHLNETISLCLKHKKVPAEFHEEIKTLYEYIRNGKRSDITKFKKILWNKICTRKIRESLKQAFDLNNSLHEDRLDLVSTLVKISENNLIPSQRNASEAEAIIVDRDGQADPPDGTDRDTHDQTYQDNSCTVPPLLSSSCTTSQKHPCERTDVTSSPTSLLENHVDNIYNTRPKDYPISNVSFMLLDQDIMDPINNASNTELDQDIMDPINNASNTELDQDIMDQINNASNTEFYQDIMDPINNASNTGLDQDIMDPINNASNTEFYQDIMDPINNASNTEFYQDIVDPINNASNTELDQDIMDPFSNVQLDQFMYILDNLSDGTDNNAAKPFKNNV